MNVLSSLLRLRRIFVFAFFNKRKWMEFAVQDIQNPLLNPPPVVSQVIGRLLWQFRLLLKKKKNKKKKQWYWHFLYSLFLFVSTVLDRPISQMRSFLEQLLKESSMRRTVSGNGSAKNVTSRITEHLLYCRAVTNRVRILVRCNSSLLMSYRHLNTAPPKWWFKAPILKYTSKATSIINWCSISREHEHYAASITRIAFKWQQRRICWFSTHSI